MRCPFCGHEETQVKDSRPSDDGSSIRRRRACPVCAARFTTLERIQLREMTVQKNDGRSEPFDREKMMRSMRVALRKRPIDETQIDKAANGIVRQLESAGDTVFTTRQIGEYVLAALAQLDMVAYIRYASVYKAFDNTEDFNAFIEELQALKAHDHSHPTHNGNTA